MQAVLQVNFWLFISKNIYYLSFSVFQDTGVKKRRLQYHRANLQIALEATQRGVSIYRAARQYCVPETTLRVRAGGRVEVGATIGLINFFLKMKSRNLRTT